MFERHKGKCLIIAAVMCCVIYMLWVAVEDKYDAYAYDQELRFIPLDDDFRDEQGLVYSLNDAVETKTASVSAYINSSGFAVDIIIIPESVFYNDNEYVVDTVDFSCFANKEIEFLNVSDTVENYDNMDNANINIRSLRIGELGVNINYKSFCLWSELRDIYVSAQNTAYSSAEGVLYDANKEKLFAVAPNRSSEKLNIPDTVTTIGRNAFKNSNVKVIDDMNVLSIEDSAFEGSVIESVDIKTVINIGYRAFYNCKYINNLEFSDKVHIGEQAFYNCNSIKWLYLPGDVTIDNSAFCYCANLEVVAIGEGKGIGKVLEAPGNGEFFNCLNVKAIYFPETMEIIDGAFNTVDKYNDNIERIYIPTKKNFNSDRFAQPLINIGVKKELDIFFGDGYDYSKVKVNTEVVFEDEDGIIVADVYESMAKAVNFRYYEGMKPISFKNSYQIYGEGYVTVSEYSDNTSEIYGDDVLGVMIPLGVDIGHERSIRVFVQYRSEYPMRIWLSNNESEKLSEPQRLISGMPVVLTNDITDWYEKSDYLIIKGKNSSFIVDELYIDKIYIQVMDEDDTSKTVYTEISPEGGDVCGMPTQIYDVEGTRREGYTTDKTEGGFVSWAGAGESKFKGWMLRFNKPKNLSEYNYIAVDAAGEGTYNVSVKDYYTINQYGDENNVGRIKNITLPAVFNLADIKSEGMDYSSVIGVSVQPYNSDYNHSMNVKSVTFYKNEEDIPDFTAQKPVVTPEPTSTPRPTRKPIASPKPTPVNTISPMQKPIINHVNSNNVVTTTAPVSNHVNTPVVTQKPKETAKKNTLKKPVIKVAKGKTSTGIKYILIKLKKYSGKYIQIYAGTNGKMKCIKLSSNKIKAKSPSFKLQYTKNNTTIYVKVRTYNKKKNNKVYSKYSVVKKIKV